MSIHFLKIGLILFSFIPFCGFALENSIKGTQGLLKQASCQKTIVLMRHAEKNRPSYGEINCQGENRALALPKLLEAKYGKPIAIYASNPTSLYYDAGCLPTQCCTYNRAIASINPTAVYFQMPIILSFDFRGMKPYNNELPEVKCNGLPPPTPMMSLNQPAPTYKICDKSGSKRNGNIDLARSILNNNAYCNKTVFVAWEHEHIPLVAYGFFHILGLDPVNKIPVWPFGPCLYDYCHRDMCAQTYNFDSLYVIRIDQSKKPPTINITIDKQDLNGKSTACPT